MTLSPTPPQDEAGSKGVPPPKNPFPLIALATVRPPHHTPPPIEPLRGHVTINKVRRSMTPPKPVFDQEVKCGAAHTLGVCDPPPTEDLVKRIKDYPPPGTTWTRPEIRLREEMSIRVKLR